jgi:hypothetical protein
VIVRNGSLGDGDFGFFVATPGQMLDEATAVRAEIWRLANDSSTSRVPESLKKGIEDFVAEYENFYSGLQGVTGWTQRLWGTTWEQIQNYKRRAADWQAKFSSAGGTISGPAIDRPANPFSLGGALGDLKWIAIAGLGIYLVATFGGFIPRRK